MTPCTSSSASSSTSACCPRSLPRISPLQAKGMMSLGLVLFAESVAVTNAVNVWSTSHHQQNHQQQTRQRTHPYKKDRFDSRSTRTTSQVQFASNDPCFPTQQQPQQSQQQPHLHREIPNGLDEPESHDATATSTPTPTASTTTTSTQNCLLPSYSLPPIQSTVSRVAKQSHSQSHPSQQSPQQASLLEAATTAAACPRGGHLSHSVSTPVEAVTSSLVLPFLGIPLNGWKVIFQAFLTTLNVLCWLIPLRSKQISENKLALSLANAFSGGVFLSLAFGHLLPECVHAFEHATAAAAAVSAEGGSAAVTTTTSMFLMNNHVVPYLLVLAGYLLIFFVEKVAFDAHDILHEMEHGGGGQQQQHNHHQHQHQHQHGDDDKDSTTGVDGDKENGNSNNASSGRSAVILLGALAVHSVLEMAALGLADTFKDSAILTLSIALHQPAESIALLVAFLKSGMPKEQIIRFLSVFSTMGPIGVALGMAVNEFAAPIVDAIMVAVVAGTFVYVGATEVIPEEWESSEHKWKKFFSLMAGIISILVITQYTATLEM